MAGGGRLRSPFLFPTVVTPVQELIDTRAAECPCLFGTGHVGPGPGWALRHRDESEHSSSPSRCCFSLTKRDAISARLF